MSKDILIYILLFVVSILLILDTSVSKTLKGKSNNFLYESSVINQSFHKELTLIYITSSSCPYCNDERLLQEIDHLKQFLNTKALELELNFKTIAINTSKNLEPGFDHIQKSGFYDEVLIGGGWNSIGSLKFIKDDFKGQSITPQVILILREFSVVDTTNNNYLTSGVVEEFELARKSGIDEILSWKDSNYSFPDHLVNYN